MLTFYYHPLSPVARRVWLALLEKGIDYEPVIVHLNGEQHKPNFLELNPFHHVPVLVDDGFSMIESIAILDYLELKYPEPSLVPTSPKAIAQMRMAQMVVVNEITTNFAGLMMQKPESKVFEKAIQHIHIAFGFLGKQLGRSPYFGGSTFSLGDVVVGPSVALSDRLGVSLDEFPVLKEWLHRVTERDSWQATEPSDAEFEAWKRWVSLMIKRKQKQASK